MSIVENYKQLVARRDWEGFTLFARNVKDTDYPLLVDAAFAYPNIRALRIVISANPTNHGLHSRKNELGYFYDKTRCTPVGILERYIEQDNHQAGYGYKIFGTLFDIIPDSDIYDVFSNRGYKFFSWDDMV